MWNIFLMESLGSILSSPGTGVRFLPPCTKSGQSGKVKFPGVRLMLLAESVNTTSGARVVVGSACQIFYEPRDTSFKKKMKGLLLVFPTGETKTLVNAHYSATF